VQRPTRHIARLMGNQMGLTRARYGRDVPPPCCARSIPVALTSSCETTESPLSGDFGRGYLRARVGGLPLAERDSLLRRFPAHRERNGVRAGSWATWTPSVLCVQHPPRPGRVPKRLTSCRTIGGKGIAPIRDAVGSLACAGYSLNLRRRPSCARRWTAGRAYLAGSPGSPHRW
jgi:hypothetical protein